MEIKFIDKSDELLVNLVRDLYTGVFADTQDFTDYFFSIGLESASILAGFINDRPVSVMFLCDKKIVVNQCKKKGCYIYGVATEPQYRGLGFMSKLMEYALDYCKNVIKYEFIYLVPVDHRIYEKFGFRLINSGFENKTMSDDEIKSMIKNHVPALDTDIAEMSKFAQKKDEKLGGIFIYKDEEYFKKRLLQAQAEHCGIWLHRSRGGNIDDIVITGTNEDDSVCIAEHIGDNSIMPERQLPVMAYIDEDNAAGLTGAKCRIYNEV